MDSITKLPDGFSCGKLSVMAGTGKKLESLRFNRFDYERLALVLAISLAAHLMIFGGYKVTRELLRYPWMQWLARKLVFVSPPQKQPQHSSEQPLEFVMVQNPSPTAPQNAKYYGAKNSRAADDTRRDSDVAEIKGKQHDVPLAEVAPKPEFNKLQPTPPPQPSQAQPQPATEPGDLMLAKLNELRQQQQQQRPRTLAQVLPHKTPGVLMRQVGGAHEIALQPSFDVKATAFGAYDEAFIEAVQQRWNDLLDSHLYAYDRTGKVTLQFHLNYDGSITGLQVLQNNVGPLLGAFCEDAINDPAPYAAWPEDMRHEIGGTYREITFTFYYY